MPVSGPYGDRRWCTGGTAAPAVRQIPMNSSLSQALVAARTAEIRREAQAARLASDVRRARRASRPVLARRLRTASPARRAERAGLPAA
jgi:hypothetical protein